MENGHRIRGKAVALKTQRDARIGLANASPACQHLIPMNEKSVRWIIFGQLI